ncbi:hypothetical protein V6N13_002314 [Hibiscus sabdariffa]|uniref:Uncharacterized protein n=1 Tax=Hibiscus sabdariffa TaxID=183260 RepID=A0ABR2C3Z5_9ROSI
MVLSSPLLKRLSFKEEPMSCSWNWHTQVRHPGLIVLWGFQASKGDIDDATVLNNSYQFTGLIKLLEVNLLV